MSNKTLTTLTLLAIVIVVTALVSSPILNAAFGSHDKGNQKSKDKVKVDKSKLDKPKDVKCNNVKILLKVSHIPKDTSALVANLELKGAKLSKTAHVEGDKHIAIPFQFKKLNPCPVVGDSFSGEVNGTSINGELKSLKKPNKVSVSLP